MENAKMMDKRVSLKSAIVLVLIAVLIASGVTYVLAVSPSSTFTVSPGVYPGAPSYTVWREGSNYFAKDSNGVIAYSGSNAREVIQNCINAGDKILLKKGIYELNNPIIINRNNIVLEGEVADREQVYFLDPPTPLARLTKGTVLKVTTPAIDAIQVTGERYGVGIKHLSIDFTQSSTGHGINCIANNEVGLSEFAIEDVFVNNHDGSHYALRMENGVLGTVDRLTSFGGGALELVSESTAKGSFNSGNIVFRQLTHWVCHNLGTHAVYIHRASGSGWSNLYLFDRLFIICKSTVNLGTYSLLRAEYLHHSQFNKLNIETAPYASPVDVVHLAEVHDTDFVSPYIMHNTNAGWMSYIDCDGIRVFGGNVDVIVSDRSANNTWFGTSISSLDGYHKAILDHCFVWSGTAWKPTYNSGTATGASPITVTHGLITTPTSITITPRFACGDWYVTTVGATTFQITFASGTPTFYWIAKYGG